MVIVGRARTASWATARWCGVVALGDLSAVALLADQLLLGQELIGEHGIDLPDLVELGQLASGVIATVADQLTERAQFFCSTCAPSFLLPGRERVKVT